MPKLFTKLGINLTLAYDRYGTWLGGYAADGSTLEYAKFGLLYLRDGIWAGQRILPPGWVEYSRTPSRSNARYGAGWWLAPEARLHSPAVPDQGSGTRPGAFFALGAHGQVIGVDPAARHGLRDHSDRLRHLHTSQPSDHDRVHLTTGRRTPNTSHSQSGW